jgi:hypothetical protein
MDDLDQMLAALKQESPPPGLPQRTRIEFRRRRRKQVTLHTVFSLAMIAAGLWLLLPAAGVLHLPDDGLSMLQNMFRVYTSGAVIDAALTGATSMQTTLSASLGPANWLGLVALGVGLMLGMSAMLPGRDTEF